MNARVRIAGELVSTVVQHIMGKVCQQLLQLKQNKPTHIQLKFGRHILNKLLAQNPGFFFLH